VPEKRIKLNERECAICSRVKLIRKSIKWAQEPFANQLGITRDQLANIESARTPLRYEIAWKIRVIFGLSLAWLADGEQLPDSLECDDLPLPELTGLTKSALLSEVSDKIHGLKKLPAIGVSPSKKLHLNADRLQHRIWCLTSFRSEIAAWIARVPDAHIHQFSDKLIEFANTYLTSIPADDEALIQARHDAMLWPKFGQILQRDLSAKQLMQNKA